MKSIEVPIKARSTPASLSFKGQTTKHTTVKWSIRKLKMARGREEERSRITLKLVSLRNSCGIFRCYSNYSSFYAFQRASSTQTSVVTRLLVMLRNNADTNSYIRYVQKLCTFFSWFFVFIPVHLFPLSANAM